jgi:hypothetical protein
MKAVQVLALCLVFAGALTGCGDDGMDVQTPSGSVGAAPSTSTPASGTPSTPSTPTTTPGPANSSPKISGQPATSVVAGTTYVFQPAATDADGDTVSFTIQNKPQWASFDARTGKLAGTPAAADIGLYSNITIRANDGEAVAALPAFSIEVDAIALGSATVSWTPPTQNTDGTTLSTLAGYRISYGTTASNLDRTVDVGNAGLSSYVIENLSPATWYFGIRAYTAAGVESALSALGTKQIH